MENKTKTTKIKNSSPATLDFPAIRACDNKNLCKSLNFTHKQAPSKGLNTQKIKQGNTSKAESKKKVLNKINKTNPAKNINQNKTKATVKKNTNLTDQIFKTTSGTKNKTSGEVKTNKPITGENLFTKWINNKAHILKTIFKTLITRTR